MGLTVFCLLHSQELGSEFCFSLEDSCDFAFDQWSIVAQITRQDLIKVIGEPLDQILLGLDSSRLSFLCLLNSELLFHISFRWSLLRFLFFFLHCHSFKLCLLLSLSFGIYSVSFLGFNEIARELISDNLGKLIQIKFVLGLFEGIVEPCRLFFGDFGSFFKSFALQDRSLIIRIGTTSISIHRNAKLLLTSF